MPTWNHLWFVAYLWVYTLALGGLLALPRPAGAAGAVRPAVRRHRCSGLPLAWLLLFQVVLFRHDDDTHDLVGDGIAHLALFPGLPVRLRPGRSRPAMAALARLWKPAAVLAVASYAVVAWVDGPGPVSSCPAAGCRLAFRIAREVQCWASIAALIGVAERFLEPRPRAARRCCRGGVPLLHHPPDGDHRRRFLDPAARAGRGAEFAILVAATIAGCWAFYLAGGSWHGCGR